MFLNLFTYLLTYLLSHTPVMMVMMVVRSEIRALYPNKFLQYDEQRIYILNTLFNLPGQCTLCHVSAHAAI